MICKSEVVMNIENISEKELDVLIDGITAIRDLLMADQKYLRKAIDQVSPKKLKEGLDTIQSVRQKLINLWYAKSLYIDAENGFYNKRG